MIKKLIFLAAMLNVLVLFTPACNTDQCKDVDCGLYGTCFEGVCSCELGYEQDAEGKCTIEEREKFLGTYNTTETCGGPSSSYSNTVTSSGSDVRSIVISNFGDSGVNAIADVDGSNVTVRSFNVTINNVTTAVSGAGSLNGNTITINYQGSQGGSVAFTCTKTMTKI